MMIRTAKDQERCPMGQPTKLEPKSDFTPFTTTRCRPKHRKDWMIIALKYPVIFFSKSGHIFARDHSYEILVTAEKDARTLDLTRLLTPQTLCGEAHQVLTLMTVLIL